MQMNGIAQHRAHAYLVASNAFYPEGHHQSTATTSIDNKTINAGNIKEHHIPDWLSYHSIHIYCIHYFQH